MIEKKSGVKVSVVVITYNHEKFISKAIDSILMQKTNFELEIIIGEDDSDDSTREIVLGYKKKYPDIINIFLRDRKDVISINGRPSGRFNFIKTIEEANGEYVALLEGDDYWLSPDKLQRQIDYLDNNPAYSICFHSASKLNPDGIVDKSFYTPNIIKDFYTTGDLIRHGNFIPTASTVFRRGLFGDLPKWYYEIDVGDWSLHILNSMYGKIGYIDETMSMYRVHSGGIFSELDEITKLKIQIDLLWKFNEILKNKYTKTILNRIARITLNISMIYDEIHNIQMARLFARKSLFYFPHNRNIILVTFKYLFRLYFPRLHKVIKK